MHTALHDNDGNALYMAEYKAALVAGHSGDGETLDIVVIDGGYGFDSIRIIAKTRPKNKCDLWNEIRLFTNTF